MINNGKSELTKDLGPVTENNYVKLKDNLKRLIKENNLNALKLSKATGVPNSTISDWLLGNSPKNIIQVKTIATYFNISIDELIFGDGSLKKIKSVENIEIELLKFGTFDVFLKRNEQK